MGAEKIGEVLEKAAGPGAREAIVTFIDEIELKGERRGELKGERKGRAGMLLDLLAARFGTVPAAVRAKVQEADEATLTRWGVRVLTAPSAAAVVGRGSKGSPARKTVRVARG